MSDWELLQSWAREQSESAFAALVHRHVNLVYGSALRQMRDAELAGDATQAVFLLLSRKAKTLRREVILSGWLFRATSQTDRPPRPAAPPSPFRQPYDTSFRRRLFEQEIYDRSVNRVPPGRFRGRFLPVEDVAPGSYILNLAAAAPKNSTRQDRENFIRNTRGKLSVPVTVPEGDIAQPLDLGTLTIPVE